MERRDFFKSMMALVGVAAVVLPTVNMREFHAERPEDTMIRVFLNGVEVEHGAFYLYGATEPNVKTWGKIGMFTEWPPVLDPATNDVAKRYIEGFVHWEPRLENA